MKAITGIHPYADMYPMLPESKIASLAESITANGLREPVVVTPEGLILDGRNRYLACQRAGITPSTEVYGGDDLAEYVMDRNDHRRHIPTGQSAMAAAMVLQADGRRRNGRWMRGSVDAGNNGSVTTAWKQRLKECGVILDHAPHLAPQVRDGHLALDAAFKQAKTRRDTNGAHAHRAPQPAAVDEPLPFDDSWTAEVDDIRNQHEWEKQGPRARAVRYTEIAAAVAVAARHGRDDNIDALMAEFDPAELAAADRRLQLDELQEALHFMTELIQWRKNQ